MALLLPILEIAEGSVPTMLHGRSFFKLGIQVFMTVLQWARHLGKGWIKDVWDTWKFASTLS